MTRELRSPRFLSNPPRELRCQRLLGSNATYAVIETCGDEVVAEVVDVPGLAVGTRFRLTAAAVAGMTVLPPRSVA